ncbi:translation elongation factor aEF-1 subunit beta [Candidatus Mancarchaeum acidiphilum]|uniref:Elongation factor 1-beta n=1 Tax=Candidatus Mancarchaeum acidiphilum TaxID=1920749 RepID=A0A218NN97_9ARCH|nr:hypothetical protein [Candidatus Mancarchaeum acidiphilum]ASI13945.1 translation elongation factor aEF-1 subunit beta [Candidatus Mancarchaeum acidiphilum]
MAKVGVVYKVYPKQDVDADTLMGKIKSELSPVSISAEDIAFGIKVIKAFFTYDDSEQGSSTMEEKLNGIDGVAQVEVDEESLI